MELLYKFFENLFLLASAMSFFILLGLLIAGVLKQLIAEDFVSKHLGKSSFASVFKAVIFGTPLPVCSCSVIPFAKSLQKEGASSGAVESFLISAPITGVDSILATYSIFGWFFTIYRVVTSMIIAITVGILENIFGKEKIVSKPKFSLQSSPNISKVNTFSSSSCCSTSSCCSSTKKGSGFSIKQVFNYAFNTLFGDIAKSLLIGLILGALFTTFIPKDILNSIFENQIASYFLVILVAMPLYVCATSSLPIAAAFIVAGMSPGAAFIFLSAGPATSTVTMGVVVSMFGKRSLAIYIGVIATLSIAFGFLLDNTISNLDIISIKQGVEGLSNIDIASTVLFFALALYYTFRRK